ncbi:MAG: flagellar hook-basal body complex protein [Deltaproteobacteria bacterium]|nr:flagellar hook-basal body complex protein [Candidatus Anaeroferrophillus wilburensis]MBN2888492.1 flagellar hook-basal body complex protein [Deltaproteobacteria bacterium]
MALTSLYAGVSGLNVNGDAISVIGNNIANSNTIGFKGGRVQFQDIVSKSIGGGGSSQIGRGAHTGNISTLFTQSSFETTSRTTDLAVDGEGFFIVNDNGVNLYTRAGDFIFDKDGYMVNSGSLRVQGWGVDEDGGTIGDITDINIADVSSSSRPTEIVSIGANLDSTSETRFVLDDYNNQIVVDGTTVTLNAGTYTGETLAAALEERISGALGSDFFTVTYSPVTGKFTFANDTGAAVDLEMGVEDASIREILGFDPATVTIADGANILSGTPRLTDKLFYANNNNNTLVFTLGGVEYTAIIPASAIPYNTQEISTGPSAGSISTAVEDALNGVVAGTPFTVAYDDDTGKFTIASSSASEVTFLWQDERTSAEQLLGFASEYDPNNTLTVNSFTIPAGGGDVESVYSPNTVFDPTGATYSTALNVYDTLGSPHTVTLYFKKVSSNNWEWFAVMNSDDLDNGIPDPVDGSPRPMMVGNGGTLEFNPNGSLKAVTGNDDLYVNFSGGADLLQPLSIDFGTSTQEGGSGLDGTTQYANASATFSQSQDGFPAGALTGVSVGREGLISGVFSNGEIKPLAQLALAMFQSPWGLVKEGNNLWSETVESGNVSVGLPQTAGRGEIAANSLEQSNVDIATEFVRMISAQRAFQANARMITTSDELLNDVVNLKR